MSLDGKIADARRPAQSLGTGADKALMRKIRAQADVVVMGADTLRVLGRPIIAKNKKKRLLANAIVSQSGKIDPSMSFWKDPNVIRFLFSSEENYSTAVNSAQDRAFVVSIGKNGSLKASKLIETLQKAGFQNVLVEGGGKLVALFLEENLIDELYLTLTPWMIGGTTGPSLVTTADALSPWRKLKLLSQKKIGNEVFLHYRFLNAPQS